MIGYRKAFCLRGHPRTDKNLYKRKNGYDSCRECASIWRKTYNDKHKETRRATAETRQRFIQNRKRRLVGLAGGKCVRCGTTGEHPSVFDFDHVDPATKTSKTRLSTFSWKEAVAELKNRQLLCANCHRIKTHAPELF